MPKITWLHVVSVAVGFTGLLIARELQKQDIDNAVAKHIANLPTTSSS